jgi:hypothetical protein
MWKYLLERSWVKEKNKDAVLQYEKRGIRTQFRMLLRTQGFVYLEQPTC